MNPARASRRRRDPIPIPMTEQKHQRPLRLSSPPRLTGAPPPKHSLAGAPPSLLPPAHPASSTATASSAWGRARRDPIAGALHPAAMLRPSSGHGACRRRRSAVSGPGGWRQTAGPARGGMAGRRQRRAETGAIPPHAAACARPHPAQRPPFPTPTHGGITGAGAHRARRAPFPVEDAAGPRWRFLLPAVRR